MAAMPYRMPENSGDILRMRRYSRLETAPVPVNPAMMNPPSQTLTALDIDAQINWYATYIVVTKQVSLINQDPKRQYGVYKSSLIDLETLTSNVEGNKAQAIERCAA